MSETQRQRPVALVGEHRISAANAAAARLGILPGIKRATALALSSGVLLGEADPARDAQALQAVAHVALAFTPAVCIDGHTVMLEVQSCLRYFGGVRHLIDRLRSSLRPLAHHLQLASAPTALGAALLSRWREGLELGAHTTRLAELRQLLDEVPVWLLGPGREHWEALQGMGLHTLSDLLHLPRSGVARRFGVGMLDDLDRARGIRPDPRSWIEVPSRFESRLELAARADHAEQVMHGAAVLMARLVAWAGARQARVAAFELQMLHEARYRSDDRTPQRTTLRIELAEPSAEPEHLALLLRERLAKVALPAPTIDLLIECSELSHAPAPNGEMFPEPGPGLHDSVRLLEHLRARLGDDRVQRLQKVADHRPERSSRSVSALSSSTAAVASVPVKPMAALPLSHPVWLLDEPLPLSERQSLPVLDGATLQLLAGPERIETGWWDGGLVVRDYFIAAAADQSLVWVYCTRSPPSDASAPQSGSWYLQGRFG